MNTTTKEQFLEALQEFFGIKSKKEFSRSLFKSKALLSRSEVALLYSVSTNTIDAWTKKKILPNPIKRGRRIFYDTETINDALSNKINLDT